MNVSFASGASAAGQPEGKRMRYVKARIAMLAVLLLAFAGALVHKAYDLQVRQANKLRAMAEEQYLRDIRLTPKRGTIYDRSGAELAVSVDVDSVYANPKRLREDGADLGQVAGRLASLLGVDRDALAQRLATDRHFVWVKRRVSPKEGKAVAALGIAGVELAQESRRYYPNRELAAHLLGYANIDGQGIEGLELALDQRLRGSQERVPAIRDRRGRVVFSEQLLDDRAAQGDDVVLTIDKTIQHIAERELELSVRTFEAKGGSVVVLDPQNGEILAMANFPSFNPNEPSAEPPSHRRNRAITDRFEPGSTLKPFTLAGALAAGTVRPDQRIACEDGRMNVAEHWIRDTHKWTELTPAEILVYSSNIGTAKVGMSLGRARLYRTLRDFGFGAVTGIGLPGETAGELRHYKKWYDMDAATIAFGQGMSATALQLAVSTAAIANRGRLLKPTLIKRVEDSRGNVLEEAVPQLTRQVVPPSIASSVADMLIGVTGEGGTGVEAAIDGHLVAGKTGTAQKADYVHGGYADGKWTSSFVGFAPARKPRLVTVVVIDEPLIAHQGGSVAAPVFRRITEFGLRHLGVVASVPTAEQLEASRKKPSRRAAREAAKAEAEAKAEPAAPAEIAEAAPLPELEEGEARVPSLIGKSARAALVSAQAAGFSLSLRGTGVVVAQSPAQGAAAAEGSALEVALEPPPREPVEHTPADGAKPSEPTVKARPGNTQVAQAVVGGRDG